MGILFDTVAHASKLAPVLVEVLPTLDKGLTGAPVTRTEADWLFYALKAGEMVVPGLAKVTPVIHKRFDGAPIEPDDHMAATQGADEVLKQLAEKGVAPLAVAPVAEAERDARSPVPPTGFMPGMLR
jgi:hypothetical protein